MFDRFKPALYVTGFLWALIALFTLLTPGRQTHSTMADTSSHQTPKYQVWDIQILDAESEIGKTFRVPIVVNNPYEDHEKSETGFIEASDYESVSVGQAQVLETTYLNFQPMGGAETRLRPPSSSKYGSPGASRIRAKFSLLKSCEVEVKEVTETKIVNTGSGVIAVPKLKRVKVLKFSVPSCKDSSDFKADVSVSSEELPQEVLEAQKRAEREDVKRRLSRARADRVRAIVANWKKEAVALGPAQTTLLLGPNTDAFLHDVCSRFAALMRVLDLQDIEAKRVLKSRTQHQGYTSEVWETELAVISKDGERTEGSTAVSLQSPFVFSKLTVDDKTCLRLTPPQTSVTGGEPQSTSLKEIDSTLDRYMDERATKQAEEEIPMPTESSQDL